MDVALDKEQIAKCFLRGQETYDSNAMVQKEVSQLLVDLLVAHPEISYARVLEIGCCIGTLTSELLSRKPVEKLYLNDLVPEFHKAVLERLPAEHAKVIIPHFGDIEKLELPQELDLVISSSTFQWLVDLKTLFRRVSLCLKSNGYFVFSLFGPGTLHEFKKLTGVGLEYTPLGKIVDMLEAYFNIDFVDTKTHVLHFETPREVLRHLQATGVGGVQKKTWTRSGLEKFEEEYIKRFGGDKGVPVSFVSSYVVASKKNSTLR